MHPSTNRVNWLWPSVAILSAAVVLVTCGSPVNDPLSTVPGRCQLEAPIIQAVQTDILFVIDNSGSMKEEQAAVATELPAFIQALEAGGGLEQDFRVAVITTSVYQNAQLPDGGSSFREYAALGQAGRLQAVPDGGEGERMLLPGDPQLLEKFGRLIQVGTNGSGQETPFEAVRRALTLPLSGESVAEGGTRGFLRDGARLLVAVISDEDDCSELLEPGQRAQVAVGQAGGVDWCHEQREKLTSSQQYFDFLRGLKDSKGGRREVLWAAIAPVGQTNKEVGEVLDNGTLRNVDCPTSFQPGRRQKEMAQLFDPTLTNLDSICKPSFRDSLIAIADLANSISSMEVMNIPDPALLVVNITRADGTVVPCTLSNGGFTFEEATVERAARVNFQGTCQRLPSDTRVEVKLLCAG